MIDAAFWLGRPVFLTGHTGFKGAWLSMLLSRLGADVHGFALAPEHRDGLFCIAGVEDMTRHHIGDIRDLAALRAAMTQARPAIVIHMAAQSLVRRSYLEPAETYATNVMGTVNVLEAIRATQSAQAAIIVTSDKCYENTGAWRPYREEDRFGGYDPYSNSKGCAELVTDAYRRSFFAAPGACRIASARAGNVIGGGDCAQDRLVPDAMRAFAGNAPLVIRNPRSIRPWQHVLDPLAGYLTLAQQLVAGGAAFAQGWNFGPDPESEVPVETVVTQLASLWGGDARWLQDSGNSGTHPHEAASLRLDCTMAMERLDWRPALGLDEAIRYTVEWYKASRDGRDMRDVTERQINDFLACTKAQKPTPARNTPRPHRIGF